MFNVILFKKKNYLIKASRAIYLNRNHYMQALTLAFSIITDYNHFCLQRCDKKIDITFKDS